MKGRIRFSQFTKTEDIDRRIAQLERRKRQKHYPFTEADQRTLDLCYEFLERHFGKEET